MHLHPGCDCPDWSGQQHIAATCKESHKQGASNTNVLRLGLRLCLQASHSNLPESGIQVEVHPLTDCCAQQCWLQASVKPCPAMLADDLSQEAICWLTDTATTVP